MIDPTAADEEEAAEMTPQKAAQGDNPLLLWQLLLFLLRPATRVATSLLPWRSGSV